MTDAEKAYQYFVIAVPENEEQAKAYFWARKALQPTLTPPNEWVSVDERLPAPTENPVLVYDCTGVNMAWYSYAMGWKYRTGLPGVEITHWMPLPEPPKEETP